MKITNLSLLSSTLGVLITTGTIAAFSVHAQVSGTPLLSQVQTTAAEKIANFGLIANPEPYIPHTLTQSRDPNEGGRGVVGLVDNRIPMTSSSYPWSAIGRLESTGPDGGICTGSLVTPNVVLTNAHCVIDLETGQVKADMIFKPNLVRGLLLDDDDIANVVDVIYGTNFSDSGRFPHPNDWAFVQLDRPLGEKYGTLAWTVLPISDLLRDFEGELIMAGYSGDFPADGPARTAGVHDGCSILGEVEGSLIHDCDSYGGSSGGPILAIIDDEFRIVALNSAERYEEGTLVDTGETIRQTIINYGVKIDPIINFINLSN